MRRVCSSALVTTSTAPPMRLCSDFAPAPEVVDLDLEALVFEEAPPLGKW
jgi:hypothetical protein